MLTTKMKRTRQEDRMYVHNQTRIVRTHPADDADMRIERGHGHRVGLVLLGAALTIVLVGFGCEQTQPVVQDLPSEPEVIDTVAQLTWTTYTSDTLGITLPYPEGWQITTQQTPQVSMEVREAGAPEMSDAPARIHLAEAIYPFDEELVNFPNVIESEDVDRSGIAMKRITFLVDADLPDEKTVAYVWEYGGSVLELIGADGDLAFEYTADHLEVLP
ncbi:MAG: hypothetical protein ABIG71_04090 [Candidatus Uhrbacteria bacterium]